MAYKQNPGRGNSSKTGNGVPSALLQKKEPKEKGFFDKAKETVSGAVKSVKEGLKAADRFVEGKRGPIGDVRYGTKADEFLGVKLHGKDAGKKQVVNPKTTENKKTAPTKMKKC